MKPAAALCLAVMVTACSGPSRSASSSPLPTLAATASPSISASPSTPRTVEDWPTYHHDAARSGVGPATPRLTRPAVAWTAHLDADVYASPLVVGGNVIAATENNSVYSLDLVSGRVLWQRHLGDPVDAASLPCGGITPITGITSTPVAAGGRLYAVAFLKGRRHVLFTLDLADGSIAGQREVDPPGSDPSVQQQRSALAIGNGFVYVAFGGLLGDCGDYHGYLVAAPLAGGPLITYRNPSTREAGIWAPAGPVIDGTGDVFVVTGNGASTSSFDYSDSVLDFSPELTLRQFFAPSNWVALNTNDTDLGSVGVSLAGPNVALAIGKEGVAYTLDLGHLGGIGGQAAAKKVCGSAFGGSAVSGSTVFVGCSDALVALAVSPNSVDVKWRAQRPAQSSPILAAGAVWSIEQGSHHLYAIDPDSGASLFDLAMPGSKNFATPSATNGYILVPAGRAIVAVSTTG